MTVPPWTRWASELAGTALLVGLGTGTIVGAAARGGIPQWAMALAWTAAVLVPILLFIRVSGAHLNPAVTLALATSGRIAWAEVPPYVGSQFAGAFLGSALVELFVGRGAHLGATLPSTTNLLVVFVGELAFTALLIVAVFWLSDRGEGRVASSSAPSSDGRGSFHAPHRAPYGQFSQPGSVGGPGGAQRGVHGPRGLPDRRPARRSPRGTRVGAPDRRPA